MSGRSKKKSQKAKLAKTQLAAQPTVRAATVRTELSPYNRDYVEPVASIAHKFKTAQRGLFAVKAAPVQDQMQKAIAIAKASPIVKSIQMLIKRPHALAPKRQRNKLKLLHLLLGATVLLAVTLIGAGLLLIRQPELFPETFGLKNRALEWIDSQPAGINRSMNNGTTSTFPFGKPQLKIDSMEGKRTAMDKASEKAGTIKAKPLKRSPTAKAMQAKSTKAKGKVASKPSKAVSQRR